MKYHTKIMTWLLPLLLSGCVIPDPNPSPLIHKSVAHLGKKISFVEDKEKNTNTIIVTSENQKFEFLEIFSDDPQWTPNKIIHSWPCGLGENDDIYANSQVTCQRVYENDDISHLLFDNYHENLSILIDHNSSGSLNLPNQHVSPYDKNYISHSNDQGKLTYIVKEIDDDIFKFGRLGDGFELHIDMYDSQTTYQGTLIFLDINGNETLDNLTHIHPCQGSGICINQYSKESEDAVFLFHEKIKQLQQSVEKEEKMNLSLPEIYQ